METSSSDSDSDDERVAENFDLVNRAAGIVNNLIPEKSVDKYRACYKDFEAWKKTNNIDTFKEEVFLIYFDEISAKYKPSTLWSRWSMLKKIMDLDHGIDLDSYKRLKALIKKKSKGFQSRKSKVLTASQIATFLTTSPDAIYLAMKVSNNYIHFQISKYIIHSKYIIKKNSQNG